jgi:hypothetical protein
MGKIAEGTPEWFKSRKQSIVKHVRALDCIASARRSIASLLSNWENPDPEVRAALHSAAVISYARPFSTNRDAKGKSTYSHRHLKDAPGFDPSLHLHLLDLRNRIIAHHDTEYLPAKLLTNNMRLEIGAEVLVGVSVHIQSLYSIEDQEIARRYSAHFDAAIEAIEAILERELKGYFHAGQQWPDAYQSTAREGPQETVGEFRLSEGAKYFMPHAHKTTLGQLPVPTLSVGGSGYSYWVTGYNVMIEGKFRVDAPRGSVEIDMKPIGGSE